MDEIHKPAGHTGKTPPRHHQQAKTAPQEKLLTRETSDKSTPKGQPTCGNYGCQHHGKPENCPEVHAVPTAKNLDTGVMYADPSHMKVSVSTLNLNVMIIDLSI